ncbi:transcription factor [Mortierella alpina]|nr:transcription factor [Mortierella alpina]
MTEEEWRSLGVKQSQGWEHYMIHSPEPHVLLFKREKDYQLKYGASIMQNQAQEHSIFWVSLGS